MLAALRSFVAGAGLLLPALVLRRPWPRGWRVWLAETGAGLSLTARGFGGMFLAGGEVTPGLATVLANVQPLLAAALAFFVLGERLGPRRRVGLFLGFAGILLVAAPGFASGSANSSPLGVAYIALGAVGVAVGNVLLKWLAGRVDLLVAMGWQLVLGGLPLLAGALRFEATQPVTWNLTFVTVLLSLALPGTALAFTLWFSLLHRGELTRLNTFTFLTPVFALIIGALFFAETLSLLELGGVFLILAGLAWISRQPSVQLK
jgi:drug/metabolite transporter (DMT)-like permease